MIWSPDQSGSEIANNNSNVVNPIKQETVVQSVTKNQASEVAVPSVAEIQTTEITAISAPSWSEITPISGFASGWDSTTIEYQSITVPSVDEIDQQLTNEKNQTNQG